MVKISPVINFLWKLVKNELTNPYSPSKEQRSNEWDLAGQNRSDAKASVHTQESPRE